MKDQGSIMRRTARAFRSTELWIFDSSGLCRTRDSVSTKRIEGCDVPCGEARAVGFAWRHKSQPFALAIFMEGADQATKRLL
jgi:hypothetical protein